MSERENELDADEIKRNELGEPLCGECETEITEEEQKDGGLCESCARSYS